MDPETLSEEVRHTAHCCWSDLVLEETQGKERCCARGCEGLACGKEASDEDQGSWSEDLATYDRWRVIEQGGEANCDRREETSDEVGECHQDPWANG